MAKPMTTPNPFDQVAHAAFEALRSTVQQASRTADGLQQEAHDFVERGTEQLGRAVTPFVENPVLNSVTQLPMLRWFAAALGQVDVDKVNQDVQRLRQQHPQKTRAELSQQLIQEATLKAAGIGLATNILPPVAALLFAVDIAALSSLQAEMIFRIAAIYDLPLKDDARRGEVLTIYGLSFGGTSLIKTGLSVTELIPGVGAVIGASSDAALLFTLGQAVARFYETKFRRAAGSER
jgi:uncharacterized protein (DUF697 family)